jgi:hypothetical protein
MPTPSERRLVPWIVAGVLLLFCLLVLIGFVANEHH